MGEFLKTLLNFRSLRAACSSLTVEQIEEALKKLTQLHEDRKKAEELKLQEHAEYTQKVQHFLDQMKKDGINPVDLVGTIEVEKKPGRGGKGIKRAPRPPKYEYTDSLTGEMRTWTGQGRLPSPIRKAIEDGSALEDFLIKKGA